jgi:hypothetical protein
MTTTSWTDRAKNRVIRKLKEERSTLRTIKWRKANWIGHILSRNCFLKYVIEGNIEATGRKGRSRKQLLGDLKERRRYRKMKQQALDRTRRRTRFGRDYGPVVRQAAECWWWETWGSKKTDVQKPGMMLSSGLKLLIKGRISGCFENDTQQSVHLKAEIF